MNKWNHQLLGQTFFSICGDNKNLYEGVHFKNNWITDGEVDAMLNEPIPCPPPEGMKTAQKGAIRKELR